MHRGRSVPAHVRPMSVLVRTSSWLGLCVPVVYKSKQCRHVPVNILESIAYVMLCRVTLLSSLCDVFFPCGTADGWDSADQHLLSRVACSILDPDWEGHAVMLSVQDILA